VLLLLLTVCFGNNIINICQMRGCFALPCTLLPTYGSVLCLLTVTYGISEMLSALVAERNYVEERRVSLVLLCT